MKKEFMDYGAAPTATRKRGSRKLQATIHRIWPRGTLVRQHGMYPRMSTVLLFYSLSLPTCFLAPFVASQEIMTGVPDGESVTLDLLKKKMDEFAKERNWERFHSPRNLLLALVGEVGELSEIFQWKGEVPKGLPDWKEEEKVHLGEELSDVLLYLVRLSDMCGVDLGKAALRKVELNAIKYPVTLSKTSSDENNNAAHDSV
ncbi:hypothetical protein Pint_01457 [Pistacia integerrima]|uniref:Uncharacterized protein n=1 Tax=Pistacia integerrima TaxID=434235 RepID=A0ACC0ZGZ9_9ROSI|nr:hypothetical protein Pint_01457 [Pistacia integerrima]